MSRIDDAHEIKQTAAAMMDNNNISCLKDYIDDAVEYGHLAEAIAKARRDVKLSAVSLGECHPVYGASLSNLARLLYLQGDLTEAEQRMNLATTICRDTMGEQHPQFAACLINLAMILQRRGDVAQASRLTEEAQRILVLDGPARS
jgi:tetratricopeptide (TPR) repeat protein